MADKLKIKNFGPLKNVEIDVHDMMLFIGPQASGKSSLAKLITILNDFNFQQDDDRKLVEELRKYNLAGFLKTSTEITYDSLWFEFKYTSKKEEKLHYEELFNFFSGDSGAKKNLEYMRLVLSLMINLIVRDGKSDIFVRELQLDSNFGLYNDLSGLIQKAINKPSTLAVEILKAYRKPIDEHELRKLNYQVKRVFSLIKPLDSMYIPSERAFLPLIVNNIAGLINNKVALPTYILHAAQEFEKALQNISELDLDIIGPLKFRRKNNQSYIYHNLNQKVYLRESSSGVQSILPILLLVESSTRFDNYINLNYVVEEPEINLYPEAQYSLIKYLVKNCLETEHNVQSKNLIITTHSPYILTAVNNLLLASKKGKINPIKTSAIIEEKCWINPSKFNAYEVKDGFVNRIYNKKDNLISDNIINDVNELLMDDFKSLAIIND